MTTPGGQRGRRLTSQHQQRPRRWPWVLQALTALIALWLFVFAPFLWWRASGRSFGNVVLVGVHAVRSVTRPLWDRPPRPWTEVVPFRGGYENTSSCSKYHGWVPRSPAGQARLKVFDCFIFSTELDLLEVRLHELADHGVDKFVLVESTRTHTYLPKPLVYHKHRNDRRFARFRERILHLVVDEDAISACLRRGKCDPADPYTLEALQRRTMMAGLAMAGLRPGDIIIVSDLDEIPRREVPQLMRGCSGQPTHLALEMPEFLYSLANRVGWYNKTNAVVRTYRGRDPGWTARIELWDKLERLQRARKKERTSATAATAAAAAAAAASVSAAASAAATTTSRHSSSGNSRLRSNVGGRGSIYFVDANSSSSSSSSSSKRTFGGNTTNRRIAAMIRSTAAAAGIWVSHHKRLGDHLLSNAGWHCTWCFPSLEQFIFKMLGR
eukprot:g14.t1